MLRLPAPSCAGGPVSWWSSTSGSPTRTVSSAHDRCCLRPPARMRARGPPPARSRSVSPHRRSEPRAQGSECRWNPSSRRTAAGRCRDDVRRPGVVQPSPIGQQRAACRASPQRSRRLGPRPMPTVSTKGPPRLPGPHASSAGARLPPPTNPGQSGPRLARVRSLRGGDGRGARPAAGVAAATWGRAACKGAPSSRR